MKIKVGITLGAILCIAASGSPVKSQNVYMPAAAELPTPTATPSGEKIDHSVSAKVALKRAKAAKEKQNYDDEGKWYGVAAEKGNAEGQYRYGLYLYDWTMGAQAWEWAAKNKEEWDAQIASGKKEGQDWLRKASAQGYKQADEALAKINSGLTPYPPEDSKNGSSQSASESASNALQTGSSPATVADGAALFHKGTEAYAAGNYEEAFQDFQKSASLGNADGENSLGLAYSNGKGVALDNVAAVKWLQKAADQGHVDATGNLGMFYLNGWGVNPDEGKGVALVIKAGDSFHEGQLGYYFYGKGKFSDAFTWFQKAATQDSKNGFAQFMLGNLYETGKGVGKDLAKAKYWYQLASDNGNAQAAGALSNLANVTVSSGDSSTGTGSNSSPSVQDALEKAEEADNNNNPQQAAYWYGIAGNSGDAAAQYKAAEYFEGQFGFLGFGSNSMSDCQNYKYWLLKSANQGYAPAEFNLGMLYGAPNSCGDQINDELMKQWVEKAAAQGFPDAVKMIEEWKQNGYVK